MRDTTTDPIAVLRAVEARAARAPREEVDEGHPRSRPPAQPGPLPSAHLAPSWSRVVDRIDRAVARVLRVQPGPPPPRDVAAATGSRPLETPLLVSAVRCTVRYVVLPFVLPLLGVAASATPGIVSGAAFGVLVILDVIAALAIVATLRRLWRLRHPRRWQYLPLALALAALVGFFLVNDTRVMYA
jgi:hypothetical protein